MGQVSGTASDRKGGDPESGDNPDPILLNESGVGRILTGNPRTWNGGKKRL